MKTTLFQHPAPRALEPFEATKPFEQVTAKPLRQMVDTLISDSARTGNPQLLSASLLTEKQVALRLGCSEKTSSEVAETRRSSLCKSCRFGPDHQDGPATLLIAPAQTVSASLSAGSYLGG